MTKPNHPVSHRTATKTASRDATSQDGNLPFIPSRIISGGQTGVDRAGLDVAIDLGIEHGGWCPAGRMATDGVIPQRYRLTETDSRDYPTRTRMNVADSDATLILYAGRMGAGTALTLRCCQELNKPHLVVKLGQQPASEVQSWLSKVRPLILNIAGSREAPPSSVYHQAQQFLASVFNPPSVPQ